MKTWFIIYAITSIVISYIASIANAFRLYKDVTDAGYKIKFVELINMMAEMDPDDTHSKIERLALLIPFYNIAYVAKTMSDYNMVRSQVVNQLRFMGVLEEMTGEEEQMYFKNPTMLNALYVSFISALKKDAFIEKVIKLSIREGQNTNTIVYEIGQETKDLSILEITGPLEQAWKSDKKDELETNLKIMLLNMIEKYRVVSEMEKAIDSGEEISSDKKDITSMRCEVYDANDYFAAKQRDIEIKKVQSYILANKNMAFDKMIFKALNAQEAENNIITYVFNGVAWNFKVTKISGSISNLPCSEQWRIVSNLFRDRVINSVSMLCNEPSLLNNTNRNLVFEMEEAGCKIKIEANYNEKESSFKIPTQSVLNLESDEIFQEKYNYSLSDDDRNNDGPKLTLHK